MGLTIEKAYESLRSYTDFEPEVALVLGSGLGNYGRKIDIVEEVSYKDIVGFPVSTAPGHEGKFLFGYVEGVPVVCMQGRVHYYEGYKMSEVVLPTRLMAKLGAKTLILTNAAGSVNPSYPAGTLMMIKDQISLFVPNPLVGENVDELGTRFPDMSSIYNKDLQDIIRMSAKENKIHLEEGVYVQTTGPSYETPSEVKMLHILGADAVGMSTTVEAIAANHAGMNVCGISCITNKGAGLSDKALSHKEVNETADRIAGEFETLITSVISKLK